ncbi:MAG: hypothetical protein MR278_06860 [Bacteroidales bacterium]|nr:hypothetical protein [Anaerotignum sp.]MCI5679677.1 hypothetical protein [Bacteroidales bacterium]MDY3925738.1 hypothetical protein [Anaerotignum sp.]
MKMVMKGNKQLRVADERVDDMLAAGFCEVDSKTGKVLREPKQDAMAELKKENKALEKENKALEKENEALKKENEAMKEELDGLKAKEA